MSCMTDHSRSGNASSSVFLIQNTPPPAAAHRGGEAVDVGHDLARRRADRVADRVVHEGVLQVDHHQRRARRIDGGEAMLGAAALHDAVDDGLRQASHRSCGSSLCVRPKHVGDAQAARHAARLGKHRVGEALPAGRHGQAAARREAAARRQAAQVRRAAGDGGDILLRRLVVHGGGEQPGGVRMRGAAAARRRPALPRSTRPAYITAMRSAISAATPRSWVTKIVPMPSSCCSRRSRISTWICTVASSAVVGSSASSRRGPQDERDGDHRALAQAARELVRVGVHPALGGRDLHQIQQLDGAGAPGLAAAALVPADRFHQVLADRVDRVERGHRLLEDHRHGCRRGTIAARGPPAPAHPGRPA